MIGLLKAINANMLTIFFVLAFSPKRFNFQICSFLNAKIYLVSLLIFQLALVTNLSAQCNGDTSLCNKAYDEVAYLTTHNAFNSDQDNFILPNQTYNITRQLNDGVRALMIDVYDVNGIPTVYHGFATLGTALFLSNLTEIKVFLDANPNEVVTIILECYVSANDIEATMAQAGLLSYVYTQAPNLEWPTLQQLITAGERLIVFSDRNDAGPSQSWYHYVWDYAVETSFSVNDTSEFNCNFNRGSSSNDLFIINHFVTDATFGVGVKVQAEIANANLFFINRVTKCRQEKARFPNFITVDFYEVGNSLETVNEINGVMSENDTSFTAINDRVNTGNAVEIFPNPAVSLLNMKFKLEAIGMITVHLFDISGKYSRTLLNESSLAGEYSQKIDISNQPSGIYFIRTEVGNQVLMDKVVIL